MTKGAATAQEIDRFKKAGFSAAVGTENNIGLGMTGSLDIFQISNLKNIQLR